MESKKGISGVERPIWMGLVAFVLLAGGCGPDSGLETRTYELTYLASSEAMGLLEPYVYTSRPGAPGAMGVGEHALTVRELPENLDRIDLVLAEFDQPPPSVLLHFTLVHADGYTEQDPQIADVEEELRGLFRFDGYRVIGTTVMRSTERTHLQQHLVTDDGDPFEIEVQVGNIRGTPGKRTLELSVELRSEFDGVVLSAGLGVREAQKVVLGTTSVRSLAEGALILMVKAVMEEGD